MTTTLISVFPPNAFIVQSSDGAYDLLSANVVTGVVTSSYLPASSTNFLTVRLQKLLALLPGLSSLALKELISNLVSLVQLEADTFTSTVTATGDSYALGLSGLAATSNMQVSIPFSTSSPFAAAQGAPIPSLASLGATFGTTGAIEQDGRTWGMISKIAASSGVYAFFAASPTETGSVGAPALGPGAGGIPYRWWNRYSTGTLNVVAGLRATGTSTLLPWLTRPTLSALISGDSNFGIVGIRIWVAIAETILSGSSSNSNRYVGLRYDNAISPNWFLCSSDGTTASEADTGIPVVVDTDQLVVVDFSTAGTLNATINGVAVTPKTTNLPTVGNAGYDVTVTNTGAATAAMLFHNLQFSRL